MAIDYREYPGPGQDFVSLTALRDSIAANCVPREVNPPGLPAGEYIHDSWQWVNGSPGFIRQQVVRVSAGDIIENRWYVNAVLHGTLDPSLWFNASDNPTKGKVDYFLAQAMEAAVSGKLVSFINLSDALVGHPLLGGGTLSSFPATFTLTDGDEVGLIFQLRHYYTYDPTPSEFSLGIKQLFYIDHETLSTSGGDVNVSTGGAGIGTAVDATPVVTVEPQSGGASWQDLVDQGGRGPLPVKGIVTHTDDVNPPDDANEAVPTPGEVTDEVFTTGNAVVVYEVGTKAISALGTLRAMITATVAALGTAYGLINKWMPNWLAAANATAGCLPNIETALENLDTTLATCCDDIVAELQRMATAQEGILEQLKPSDPPDGSTFRDGVDEYALNAQMVAETRSEIVLKAKGVEVQALGGVIPETPP